MDSPFIKKNRTVAPAPSASPFIKKEREKDPVKALSDYTSKLPVDPAKARATKVQDEFRASPWYSQLGTMTNDLVRMGAQGASLGALDEWLGPEQKALTEDARSRLGYMQYPAEIAGALASPITRGVTAAGATLRPAGAGLMQALGNMGVSMGEGAALSGASAGLRGDFGDIPTEMAKGAVLAGGVHSASKALPKVPKYISAMFSGKDPDLYSQAYKAGKESSAASQAFRAGQKSTKDAKVPMTKAKEEYAKAEKSWSTTAIVDKKPIVQEWQAINKDIKTPSGAFKGDAEFEAAYNKLKKMGNEFFKKGNWTVADVDTLRKKLRGFAKKPNTPIGMVATRLQNAVKGAIEKAQPGYIDDLAKYSRAKDYNAAGKQLASKLSRSISMGNMGLMTPFALSMGSPRLNGILANLAGMTTRGASNMVSAMGAKPSYGLTGLVPGMIDDRKKPLEINIPGGDL